MQPAHAYSLRTGYLHLLKKEDMETREKFEGMSDEILLLLSGTSR